MTTRPALALAALLAAAPLGAAGMDRAWAGEARAVVELFTSQGCSSSPAADKVIAGLAHQAGLIVLSLPVDYWDYLGWKDTLAQPGFGARQRAYALARGDRKVFTPQVVVNGATAVVGSDRSALEHTIAFGSGLPVPVEAREAGGAVAVEVGAAPGHAPGTVWLLPVAREERVAVGGGENRGRTMTYVNVVRGFVRVGAWSGSKATYEVAAGAARPEGADSYVVLLQARGEGPGRVLGAAKGPGL
jgi:hypothetical protein